MDQAVGAIKGGAGAVHGPCRNCGAAPLGPWCHACGQSAADHHRSLLSLGREAVEHVLDGDSRLWRTLPRLFVRPAALTRDYLSGRRASQTPPLRLFLAALLLVFVAGEWASGSGRIKMFQIEGAPSDWTRTLDIHVWTPWDAALNDWARSHLSAALTHPDQFRGAMAGWAHDFAFLTLPIAALSLSLMFAFRRGFVVYDHVIFSLHGLAFLGLLFVVCVLGQALVGDAALLPLLAAPAHLFVHLRGVYRLGVLGALIRASVLSVLGAAAFLLIVSALAVVGLASLHPAP